MSQSPANELVSASRESGLSLPLDRLSRIGLLDLPREVRDNIYRHLLKAPWPIVIYAKLESRNSAGCKVEKRHRGLWHCGLHNVAWNLINCRNSRIASESALAFYELNQFKYQHDGNWEMLHRFLLMIGKTNRQQLRNLVLHLFLFTRYSSTEHIHDAEPTRQLTSTSETLGSAGAGTASQSTTITATPKVHLYSAPTIENCFRLLSSSGLPLTLVIELPQCLPGLTVDTDRPVAPYSIWTQAYPNALEQFREQYTMGPGGKSRVSLIWTIQLPNEYSRSEIEDAGRAILEPGPPKVLALTGCSFTPFALRRRGVRGSS